MSIVNAKCPNCGASIQLDNVKSEGFCSYCGSKVKVEEAQKLMIQGTVKVDTSDELANLYQIARRAKDADNSENAHKYYDMILVKDPNSWEANFYYCCPVKILKRFKNNISPDSRYVWYTYEPF